MSLVWISKKGEPLKIDELKYDAAYRIVKEFIDKNINNSFDLRYLKERIRKHISYDNDNNINTFNRIDSF